MLIDWFVLDVAVIIGVIIVSFNGLFNKLVQTVELYRNSHANPVEVVGGGH